MIGNTFNSLISTNSQLLLQAEEQVRGAVSKDFKTQIYSKLPTQESIKQQFLTEGQNIENAEDIKNLEIVNAESEIQKEWNERKTKIKNIKSKTTTNFIQQSSTEKSNLLEYIPIVGSLLSYFKEDKKIKNE